MNSTTLPPLKPRSKLYAGGPTAAAAVNSTNGIVSNNITAARAMNNSGAAGGLQIQQLYDNSTAAAAVSAVGVTNKTISLSNPAVNTIGSNAANSLLQKSPSVDSVGSYKSSSVNQNNSTVMKRQSLNVMTPEQSMKNYMQKLSAFEHHEIFNYQEIYFVGQNAKKIQGIN
jgi:dual specificity tyrosine-phosphorylation-regulated kinase 2/3/4